MVFEIEIPNFKHDLFRYNDSYNRPNIGYEKMIEKSRLSKIIKKKIKKKCIFIYDFKKINNKNLKGNEIIVLLKGTLKINNTALKLYKPLDLSIFNKSIHFKNNKSAKIIVINKSL